MAKIFFLDDDESRHKKFRRAKIGNQIFAAYTADQAIDFFKSFEHKYEELAEIWLDHDLGGETFVDPSSKNCGSEVVRWIIRNKPPISCCIYIHSLNHEVAPSLVDNLRAAGYNAEWTPFYEIFQ